MKRGLVLALFLALFLVSLVSSLYFVSASDLTLTVTDVTPSSVKPDEDFTVGVKVWNDGTYEIEDAVLEVKNFGEDIQMKENRSIYLGKFSRNLIYHFHTSQNAIGGARSITFELTWRHKGESAFFSTTNNFSISITPDESKLTLSGVKTDPERLNENSDFILTIKVENYGDGTAKDVRIKLADMNLEGTKDAFLGEIKSHEDVPARFVLKSKESGDYMYQAIVLNEEYGQERMKEFALTLHVFKKTSFNFLWITIALFAVAFLLLFLAFRYKGKEKDDED
jgi:hypothetical protein